MLDTQQYEQLASKIIKHQEEVVGPIAWSEARKVKGVSVSDQQISIGTEGKRVLELLVKQYETLFGRASVEVCRDAVRSMVTAFDKKDLPQILL